MNFLKKVWLSVTILLIAYATWGWILASWCISWLVWLFVVASILLLATFLTVPLTHLQRLILPWFRAKVATFLYVIFVAFTFVIFLKWIYFFVKPLVLISASILARLDLLTVGLNKSQTFITLAIVSLAGLGLGAGLNLVLTSVR